MNLNAILRIINLSLFVLVSLNMQAQVNISSLKNKGKNIIKSYKKETMDVKTKTNIAQQSNPQTASGTHYYVSATTGRGRLGTKEQPAKDLSNLLPQLKAGDVVHIAAGSYTGRGDKGSDHIKVPISIIGGYDETFSKRDPWGVYQTVFTGVNTLNGLTTARIKLETDKTHRTYEGEILIDGIIIDNGPRNRYHDEREYMIRRRANMQLNQNATPESSGIRIVTGKETRVTVRNCIVMNTAPTEGALFVKIGTNGKALIENNGVINNTGNGIACMTNWHSYTQQAEFVVRNNTVLFSWKHDPIASYGGSGLFMDQSVVVQAEKNVFAFGDMGGVDNIKLCKNLTLNDNLVTGNRKFDYREDVDMDIDEIEDEAGVLQYASTGNLSQQIKVPVSEAWASVYASRTEVSRAQVDASAQASNSDANALRSMLGLNLMAGNVNIDAEIWLPRMPLQDAIQAAAKPYAGQYGSSLPNTSAKTN
jgi:hypothetical protein